MRAATPKGAFYAFPNIAATGWKAKPLANALLEKAGVATIGGPDFGVYGEGYLRLSYANCRENIVRALKRIGRVPVERSRAGVTAIVAGVCALAPLWPPRIPPTPILDMRRFALALDCLLSPPLARAERDQAAGQRSATPPGSARASSPTACARRRRNPSASCRRALDAAQKSIDAKPKMLATRKARWKRFLNDSQTQWASWRDQECQDLAPLEAARRAGDPRLACLIEHNARRAADLKARYP